VVASVFEGRPGVVILVVGQLAGHLYAARGSSEISTDYFHKVQGFSRFSRCSVSLHHSVVMDSAPLTM
jgi:hypothetical protein